MAKFCAKCGKELKPAEKFCMSCGTPVGNERGRNIRNEAVRKSNAGKKRARNTYPSNGKMPKGETFLDEKNIIPAGRKWKWILAMAIAVCVVAGISGIFVNVKIKDNKYDKKIEEARKYIEQENYDDAIISYRDLININPKKDTAYMELAAIYTSQNQPELALEVLKEGSSKTNSKEIKKLCKEAEKTAEQTDMPQKEMESKENSLYTDYIEQTLIPAYGTSKGGRFGCGHDFETLGEKGLYNSQKPPGAFGIHSTLETDLDGDGTAELIVVRTASEELDGRLYSEHLYVQVFRMNGDQVMELAQPKRVMRYGIMKLTESGNLDVFVKEENGEKYLCVLNCMRSPMIQFSYNMFLDIMQIEGNAIVCRKSAAMDINSIYDTTDLSLDEVYAQEASQRNIVYQTDDSYRFDTEKWYGDLIETFEGQFIQYVNFNQILTTYFNSDRFVMNYSGRRDSLPLPYDFGFSEMMDGAVDVFRLRAVWANSEKMQYWDYLDYTKKRADDVQTLHNAYKKIIDEYREALITGSSRSNTQFLDVNNLGIALGGYSNERVFYSFYDIDSDGTQELLVGLNDADANVRIMDIYAYDGSIARKLLYDDTMAERSPTIIFEDGTIYKYSSGGAMQGEASFYKLSKEGYAAILNGQYIFNEEAYPDSPYYNEKEQLTKEQFDAKLAAFGPAMNVRWYNISSDEGFSGQPQSPAVSADPTADIGAEANQTGQVEAPAAEEPEEQVETPAASVSAEQIGQMIVAHYDALIEEGSGASYTIVDDETIETDLEYKFSLRFRIDPKEAEEIIAQGGMPGANKLAGIVTVNKSDGTVVIDEPFFKDTWNLWGD